ncbi:MAG: hypothetical protein IH969_10480 [Candidatus Krumholzibacteriota bacterium]|nr:hypothetical protein [Candidatus Krumholzibacteriota bacterium]
MIVSLAWAYGAYRVFRYILHLEFVAIMSMVMNMSASQNISSGAGDSQQFRMIHPEVVEPTVHIWLVLMWAVGVLLLLGGLVALFGGRRARRWNLAAAVSVLVGTGLTLVGVGVLIRWGGFPPTIKPLGYFLIIAVQSAYAWVLLLGFLRRSASRSSA